MNLAMDLAVKITMDDRHTVNLPHCFLDHLLSEGYQFEGILCLTLSTMYQSQTHVCMNEFKATGTQTIDIPVTVNQQLNVLDGDFIRVDVIKNPYIPKLVKIQGHRASFGTVPDIKQQLEELFVRAKIINLGTTYEVRGQSGLPEAFNIVEIDGDHDYGLTLDTDVQIDFAETLETIQRRVEAEEATKKEAERKYWEEKGYTGTGRRLGGGATSREEWLRRLEERSQNDSQ